MNKSKNTAIYYRTNHPNHTDHGLEILNAHATKNSLNPIIFAEAANGIGVRPCLKKLLKMVSDNQINMVITNSPTRLARKTDELAAILAEFEKHSVELVIHQTGMEAAIHE